jgi:molecular chaperone DnaK
LKKAYETKDVDTIQPALDKINEAWKNASEELYKAQAEGQTHEAQPQQEATGDQTQDVDFEEVK